MAVKRSQWATRKRSAIQLLPLGAGLKKDLAALQAVAPATVPMTLVMQGHWTGWWSVRPSPLVNNVLSVPVHSIDSEELD